MAERPEAPDLDPHFTPAENVEADHRGAVMFEYESYERVVEGLKLAADGMRNMARFRDADLWNPLAEFLDSLRKAIVQLAGLDRGADARDSAAIYGGSGLSRGAAMTRIVKGLRDAAAGANQIAQGQRLDPRWLAYANRFDALRERAHRLALAGSPLVVESGWARPH